MGHLTKKQTLKLDEVTLMILVMIILIISTVVAVTKSVALAGLVFISLSIGLFNLNKPRNFEV